MQIRIGMIMATLPLRIFLPSFFSLWFAVLTLKAADHYVRPPETCTNTDLQWPFTNWATAATNIQRAVDAAAGGETVWVTNGVYTNWATINLTDNITLRSVNGPAVTIIDGNYAAITQGCVYLNHRGAVVDGFTIRNGYRIGGGGQGGGGVYIFTQGGTVRNSVIISNICAEYSGGGIYMPSTGLVENCTIANNSVLITDASGRGGGIYLGGNTNTMAVNCLISGNYAGQAGGGVYLGLNGGLVRSCLIASNTAARWGGGAYGWNMILENCTIVSNHAVAAGGGGGIYINTTGSRIINTIIYSNKAPVALYDNYMFNTDAAGAFSNSCFYPELTGDSTNYSGNNITNNPQFTDWSVNNYRPVERSPVINAGMNQDWMSGASDLDRHGRIDKFSGRVDMGCYEYLPAGTMTIVK